MYTPSAGGGHARYTHELLSAIASTDGPASVHPSLVTSADLDPRYREAPYPVHAVLPPLAHRSSFNHVAPWVLSRVTHYHRRERVFLDWVDAHRDATEGIHIQEYTPVLAPAHFRRLKARGHRLYVTVHNLYPHRYLPERARPVYRHLLRLAWRQCDGLFVHTESLREQLLGTGHPPIFVTPHGVWKDHDSVGTGVDPDARRASRRLLFFGAIRRNKGLPVLLEAMADLSDCTLTVAGAFEDDRHRDEVAALIAALPPGRVELVDRFVPDEEVGELFAASALAVLPYTSFAAQSGVLHDALAHGLPVVVTDVGSLGESVRGWGIGAVAPAGDAGALAAAVRATLDPERYRESAAAVVRVRDDLSWDRTAALTVAAYRETGLGRARTGGP
jgi:glycosyltransferase involved in cell wall biosynthesis